MGSYLFQRVLSDGKDSRFDEIKKSPPKFLVAFVAQATWVSLCLMPILAVNSIPHAVLSTLPAIGITDIIGLLLYTGGLAFEVTADRQKDAWVQAKKVCSICYTFVLGKARHLQREPWLIVDTEEGA